MEKKCFNCDNIGTEFFGFTICDSCKKDLKLFTNKTIKKHSKTFTKSGYEKDVKGKLALLENVYIKQKIKLLDILEKLKNNI